MSQSQSREISYSTRTRRAVNHRALEHYPPGMLPVRGDPSDYYTATLRSAKAIFTTDEAELRIPFVSATEQGDFATLLNCLTDDFNRQTIRFTNLPPAGSVSALTTALPGEGNGAELRDAVTGFQEVTEEWGETPITCLLGDWNPAANEH